MKNRKKKNAITLLALVITIVIMLLLAGVAIQMTMGEIGYYIFLTYALFLCFFSIFLSFYTHIKSIEPKKASEISIKIV